MNIFKIHLIAVAVWVCLASLATVLAQDQADLVSTFNMNEERLTMLCTGEPNINTTAQPLSEWSVRPLTRADKFTWVNKVLFGKIKPDLKPMYVYGYKPETIWSALKQGSDQSQPDLTTKLNESIDWKGIGKDLGLASNQVPILQEVKEKSYWWQPVKHVKFEVIDSNYIDFPSLNRNDLQSFEQIYLNSIHPTVESGEITNDKYSAWRETFCTLQGISSQGGVIALPEKFLDYMPEQTFILEQ